MKRPKYKELHEWEKASHYATEQELQRFKKMYAELFERNQVLNEQVETLRDSFNGLEKFTRKLQSELHKCGACQDTGTMFNGMGALAEPLPCAYCKEGEKVEESHIRKFHSGNFTIYKRES